MTSLRYDGRGSLLSADVWLPLDVWWKSRLLALHELIHALGYDHGPNFDSFLIDAMVSGHDADFSWLRRDYGAGRGE